MPRFRCMIDGIIATSMIECSGVLFWFEEMYLWIGDVLTSLSDFRPLIRCKWSISLSLARPWWDLAAFDSGIPDLSNINIQYMYELFIIISFQLLFEHIDARWKNSIYYNSEKNVGGSFHMRWCQRFASFFPIITTHTLKILERSPTFSIEINKIIIRVSCQSQKRQSHSEFGSGFSFHVNSVYFFSISIQNTQKFLVYAWLLETIFI